MQKTPLIDTLPQFDINTPSVRQRFCLFVSLVRILWITNESLSGVIEPCHEIMVLFVLRKLILQTRIRSHPVGLDVWFVGPFVYLMWPANSDGSGEMHRLAWAFADRLCDNYHNLMSWPNYYCRTDDKFFNRWNGTIIQIGNLKEYLSIFNTNPTFLRTYHCLPAGGSPHLGRGVGGGGGVEGGCFFIQDFHPSSEGGKEGGGQLNFARTKGGVLLVP